MRVSRSSAEYNGLGRTISPSAPARSHSTAKWQAPRVVGSATATSTGTRAPTAPTERRDTPAPPPRATPPRRQALAPTERTQHDDTADPAVDQSDQPRLECLEVERLVVRERR